MEPIKETNNTSENRSQSAANNVAKNEGILQNKKAFIDNRPISSFSNNVIQHVRYASTTNQGVVQRMTEPEAKGVLGDKFGGKIYGQFLEAITQMGLTENIPGKIIERLANPMIPVSYLPTTPSMWVEFIKRIRSTIETPITKDSIKEMDYDEIASDEKTELVRASVLSGISDKEQGAEVEEAKLKGQSFKNFNALKPLADRILKSTLTSNFALDKLFNYSAPLLLNAFQVREKLGIVSNNIEGDLADERQEAEADLFFGKAKVTSKMRPRYSALNLNNHLYGAASRNDYGLSHFVLKDNVKSASTFTWGDTFESKEYGANTITKNGILTMLINVAKGEYTQYQIDSDWASMIQQQIYSASDLYLDTQIHADLDIRKDVKEIVISKAEMALFGVPLDVVDRMISQLTEGLFVRVE